MILFNMSLKKFHLPTVSCTGRLGPPIASSGHMCHWRTSFRTHERPDLLDSKQLKRNILSL